MNNPGQDFFIISHRGASAYMPENTIASFQRAIDMNTDMIELDVRRSLDNRLVVIHDSKLDRTTNGKGPVARKTYKELSGYDAGEGEKIPLLEDVFSLGKNKTRFVIELKEERTEEEVLKMIKDFGIRDDVFIVSFKKKVIRYITTLEKTIKTGLITFLPFNIIENGLVCNSQAIAVYKYFVTENLISKARLNNLYIFAWTVDEPTKCRQLRHMGINGVVTNKPDILTI